MNKNYVKATSENLPKVDLEMLLDYISSNDSFRSVEMRGVKALRSMRQNYGDEAIGYVQLIRQSSTCTIEAKICPEHKVRNKNYTVQVIINEKDETIIKAECRDCAASLGGCKHAVALLAWIYRRSEEPSPTSVTCYWRKSILSGVGTVIKFKKIRDITQTSSAANDDDIQTSDQQNNFLASFLDHASAKKCNSIHLVQFFRPSDLKKLSLHYQSITYEGDKNNFVEFQDFCASFLSEQECKRAADVTSDQCDSILWYELRYARITASIIYEAAMCSTLDGSLVEKIMSMKSIDTPAMKRGRELENKVLSVVEKHLQSVTGENILKSGLLLRKEFPMLGASPDGITKTAVIEVKCPSKEKSVSRFYDKNKIMNKYKAQLHLQMLFAQKTIGYFCVADPEFENNKKIIIITENFDKNFVEAVIKKAIKFWKKAIFPILIKNQVENV